MVINRITFDVCVPSNFEGVRTYVRTHNFYVVQLLRFTLYVRTTHNIYNLATHVGCDVVMTSPTHQDNQPGVVISRFQFNGGSKKIFYKALINYDMTYKSIVTRPVLLRFKPRVLSNIALNCANNFMQFADPTH